MRPRVCNAPLFFLRAVLCRSTQKMQISLRRRYKVKRREAPPSQPTCSSGALRSVGCFGCANSRLSSVIAQKQMCAKFRTLPAVRRLSSSNGIHFVAISLSKKISLISPLHEARWAHTNFRRISLRSHNWFP